MLSFRSELENIENPVVQHDIVDLAEKISRFKNLQIDQEKFRSIRLARGIYGQRQPGVQMIRIKIPYGKINTKQLVHIADLSDEYASGVLHATTRQDIQIHYVSLDHTPELWAKLEREKITLREACGNTVRNITASEKAGIDPEEPFDVAPYAQASFEYFLRNPVCQEMGRKFKIAFSSSDRDSAYTFIHDLGFIPRLKDGKRGFKVLIGGGLGAQPFLALPAYEFLEEDLLIPFTEAVLRVFDRYGERARRHKARLKFLLADIGLDELLRLVNEEWTSLNHKQYKIDTDVLKQPDPQPAGKTYPIQNTNDEAGYSLWLHTNVSEQKQQGFYSVGIRLPNGNLSSDDARSLAEVVKEYAADELRITINQGYLLKFVRPEALPGLYESLKKLGLADPGFNSAADVTSCPGTDTCNLGISSSTGIATALEGVIRNEYPDLVKNSDIKIKISGCPNSCGQHGMASIGFHGSSLKNKTLVLPALQVLLGGGVDASGNGRIAEKVTKIPSKRGPQALRILLDDYETNALSGEYYKDYFARQGKMYFYNLLKPVTDLSTLVNDDYIDWKQEVPFAVETAVGECAGVIIDLVATLLYDTEEKSGWAAASLEAGAWSDAIYHSYNVFITAAKAYLLTEDVKNNTQAAILRDFDRLFTQEGKFQFPEESFAEHVLRINKNEPGEAFARKYYADALAFLDKIKSERNAEHIANPLNSQPT